ncbi:hypothetical protein [Hankyongella ginsenosidimutans]|uniref:hypothetical protein n=1 Tax=Hankyongella ginsenosidimutans TaxID=1763828 RepID=UPI003CCC8B3C
MIDAGSPPVTYLKDYRAPDFAVERVDLAFVLDPTRTIVTSTLRVRRQGDPASRWFWTATTSA